MINGILPVNKQAGMTSFDVCSRIRRILQQKKTGHTGTLDPMAEGVLLVCAGNATRLSDYIMSAKKSYRAEMIFGFATDTLDITGEPTSLGTDGDLCRLSKEAVMEALYSFKGTISQVPPMYSALKCNGRKLYELAREGKSVKREARAVEIYALDMLSFSPVSGDDYQCISEPVRRIINNNNLLKVVINIECSKGTYIRTLVSDIGEKLGVFACMSRLTRRENGGINIDECFTLSEIETFAEGGRIGEILIKPESFLGHLPKVMCKKEFGKFLNNGNKLKEFMVEYTDLSDLKKGDLLTVYSHDKEFYGIYECLQDKELKPKVFLKD